MIQYVTGVFGAGKTFHSCRLGFEHIARGGIVITNVETYFHKIQRALAKRLKVWVENDQLRYFDPELTPNWETVIPWGESEGVVLVILDEAHLFYNARDWAATAANHKRLLAFLTQSRKCGVDVIWITQDGGNVDKQFRTLAEWELAIVNIKHMPLGWLGMMPFNAYCVKRISAKSGCLVKKEWFFYDKWIKGLYNTKALLNSEMRDLSSNVEHLAMRKLRRVSITERSKINLVDFFSGVFLRLRSLNPLAK